MSTTKYSIMKDHFDRLILGDYPSSTGLEPIRSTYEQSFGMNINLQDVYLTKLNIPTNPIKGIITLIGPDPKDKDVEIPTGLIGSDETNVFYVNHFTNDILKNIDEYSKDYIAEVFNTMRNILEYDSFTINTMQNLTRNPYIATLYSYPFYFTYHHVKNVFPHLINNEIFIDILEKYYMDRDLFPELFKSLNETKYSTDPELIHYTMTCKNTISIV